MASQDSTPGEIDTEATRRQVLFAREHVAAHSPGARTRVPQHLRLRSGRSGSETAARSARRIES
jgi:hypothetical protein